MSQPIPKIDQWYQDLDTGAMFEIVAWDTESGTVQVQYLDGEIADLDLESWGELPLQSAAAPEDWRIAFELDQELELDQDAALHPMTWGSPLNRVEPDSMLGVEDY